MKWRTQRGYTYEINQSQCSKEQLDFLKSNMGSRRYAWNKYLEMLHAGTLPADYSYKPIKEQMDWAKELDACMFDNVKRDFKKAVRDHKKNPGHFKEPKFKAKKRDEDRYKTNNNCYTTKDGKKRQTIRVQGNKLFLPKLKEPVPIIKHRCIPRGARILSATIRLKSSGKMMVSVLVEMTVEIPDERSVTAVEMLGLDYSSPDFYVDDVGRTPGTPHAYRVAEEGIARATNVRNRRVRGSKNYGVARLCVARAYEHEAHVRKDFTNKLSSSIAKGYGCVFVEDIDLRGLAGSLRLGKATNDNGFGMFRNQLAYKLRRDGGVLVKVPRFFASTKTCSCCGHRLTEIGLGVREWVCPECGSKHVRDVNAAMNIRLCGLFGLLVEGFIGSVIGSDGVSYDLASLFAAGSDSADCQGLYSVACGRLSASGTDVVTYVLDEAKIQDYCDEHKTNFVKLDDWWLNSFMTAKKKEWVATQEAPTSAA